MTNRRSAYAEKLRDPRWQKKRLKILERDEWACQKCGDSKSTLHVHHRVYSLGREPWEYPPHVLVTLCETCHENETVAGKKSGILLDRAFKLIFWADSAEVFALTLAHNVATWERPEALEVLLHFIETPDLYEAAKRSYLGLPAGEAPEQ